MKKTIALIAFCLAITTAAFPAFAQQPAATPQNPQCTPEAKTALYNEFRTNFKTDQAKANDLAMKWLACPEVAGEEQISPYLKNFVSLYEKANRKDQVYELVYAKKDYPKAFEVGKAVLTEEPENLKVMLALAYAGYAAAIAKNDAFSADAINYAKKAMQSIEGGKAPAAWTPYSGKEEALAYLNNTLGMLTVQKNPSEGLPYLIKAAQFDSKLNKLPFTYGFIAGAYEAGEYAKLSAEYKACCEGKDETPQSKLALENINQVIDRMIDAYARAVALAGTEQANQAAKKEWMDILTTWYKYRNNQSDTGLNEVIAGILSKPLPPLPTPITTLPTAAPASPPTSGTGSATGTAAGNGTTPATTQPAPAKTTPATADKPKTPAPAPTPKPRIKRNHRAR